MTEHRLNDPHSLDFVQYCELRSPPKGATRSFFEGFMGRTVKIQLSPPCVLLPVVNQSHPRQWPKNRSFAGRAWWRFRRGGSGESSAHLYSGWASNTRPEHRVIQSSPGIPRRPRVPVHWIWEVVLGVSSTWQVRAELSQISNEIDHSPNL